MSSPFRDPEPKKTAKKYQTIKAEQVKQVKHKFLSFRRNLYNLNIHVSTIGEHPGMGISASNRLRYGRRNGYILQTSIKRYFQPSCSGLRH